MNRSDIDLVMLAKAGQDDTAFADLVRRHQARLRAFILKLCGNAAYADDIAQNTFLKAHNGLSTFRSGGSFRSWLYAIAYREFLQLKRKDRALQRLEDALTSDAASQPRADSSLEASMSLDLRRALATLSDEERASLLLCDAAGLSHTEASIAIGAPLGSIKTYIARARQKMRDALNNAEPRQEQSPKISANGACYAV